MKIITIGRSSENDVCIKDSNVSRRHCQIVQNDNGSYTITDLNSTNGTFVNGKRIFCKVSLKRGDIVQIGRTTLPWMTYFSYSNHYVPTHRKNILPITLGVIGSVLVLAILVIALLFVGKGNSFGYDTDNINTQVLVSFSEDVSYTDAYTLLKKHRVQILDSNSAYGYFLVCARSVKEAESLVAELDKNYMIDCVIRNHYLTPQSVKLSALDVFGELMSASDTISHGQMVSKTMTEGTALSVNQFEVKEDGSISVAEMTTHFIKACEQMSDEDLNIVNFSLGISRFEDEDKKIEKKREELLKDEASDIIWYADLASKCGKENFIITKSMGNNRLHNYDEVLELALKKIQREKNGSQLQQALKNHYIIVAAKDIRKELPEEYSNTIKQKVDGFNTIMVDLSEFPIEQRGTSAAAPLVANWIAKSGLDNASDVIETINKATQNGELVSEQTFRRTTEIVKRQKITDNPSIKIEGILKMYVIDPDGNDEAVSQYRKTDYINDYLAFVIDAGQKIDVTQYLDNEEIDFLGETWYSTFMIGRGNFEYGPDFAQKYANKRVRVTGNLYVPGGGWRNATNVVMYLEDIKLIGDSKPEVPVKKPSTSPIRTQSFYAKLNHRGNKFTLDDGSNIFVRFWTMGFGDAHLNISWSGEHPIDVNWRLDGLGLAPASGYISSNKQGNNGYYLDLSENGFYWTESNANVRGVEIFVTPRR